MVTRKPVNLSEVFALLDAQMLESHLLLILFLATTQRKFPIHQGKQERLISFNFSISNDENNEIEKRYFFDLPGYGYARISKERIKEWNSLMETFFEFAPKGSDNGQP